MTVSDWFVTLKCCFSFLFLFFFLIKFLCLNKSTYPRNSLLLYRPFFSPYHASLWVSLVVILSHIVVRVTSLTSLKFDPQAKSVVGDAYDSLPVLAK